MYGRPAASTLGIREPESEPDRAAAIVLAVPERVCRGLALALAALAVTAPAVAAEAPTPPSSHGAVAVYVEQIPTSDGSVAAGASNYSGEALPSEVEEQLQRQDPEDAERLRALATSSGFGAPQPASEASPQAASAAEASSAAAGATWDDVLLLATVAAVVVLAATELTGAMRRRRAARPGLGR